MNIKANLRGWAGGDVGEGAVRFAAWGPPCRCSKESGDKDWIQKAWQSHG